MDIKQTFDDEAEIYEITSRQVNVYYDEGLNNLVKLIDKDTKKILDVCCGTGILTHLVATSFPTSKIVGVDFSPGMLNVAQKRLPSINFLEHDICNEQMLCSLDNDFDLVISSYGIHNIHGNKYKEKALKNIFNTLKIGGKFITLDLLQGETTEEIEYFNSVQKNHLLKSFDLVETENWLTLLKEDDPITWNQNKYLLEKIGFKQVKLLWKKDFLAIWSASK